MSARENVGTLEYPVLIGGTTHPLDTEMVKLKAGSGTIKKGTVLAYSSSTNNYVIFGTAAGENETLTARRIAAEDVELDANNAVSIMTYRSGDFIREALIVKSGSTLSDEAIYDLEKSGIYLNNAITE